MNDLTSTAIESNNLYHKLSHAFSALSSFNKGAIKHPKNIDSSTMTCTLTGALNHIGLRKYFDQVIPSDLKNLKVIFIEVDNFEQVMKKYTSKIEDKLFQKFTIEINKVCRNNEVVARWEKNGFLLICPDTTMEDAANVANEARIAIKDKAWMKGIKITSSTWLAQLNDDQVENLVTRAKETFYKARNTGGNRAFVVPQKSIKKVSTSKPKSTQEIDLSTMSCSLTGALNYKGIRSFFNQANPLTIEKMSAIFIEINNVETIEQNNGKHIVNEILQHFVDEINNTCSADGIIAHWHANQYLLACPKTPLTSAIQLAEKIKCVMQNKAWPNGIKLTCRTAVYDKGFNELSAQTDDIFSNEIENEYIITAA